MLRIAPVPDARHWVASKRRGSDRHGFLLHGGTSHTEEEPGTVIIPVTRVTFCDALVGKCRAFHAPLGDDSLQVLSEVVDSLARLRTAYWRALRLRRPPDQARVQPPDEADDLLHDGACLLMGGQFHPRSLWQFRSSV
jgi:hypothetical protein